MPDFPVFAGEPPLSVISTFDTRLSAAADMRQTSHTSAAAAAAWPSASRAILVPIQIEDFVTVTKMACYNGATVSGNVDIGIYDINFARLVSIGGVAQSGISQPQVFDITDTSLDPGTYYFALVADNATGTYFSNPPPLGFEIAAGVVQMASAYVLPSTVTAAAMTTVYLPYIGALVNGTIY